ncbi:hypothetical protein K435DRAFT_836336 [Dendrothele bispora CBS 962.96]|uniref:F-box domain-containing protein n=1 Tax=Dendrothele bispora (strain CBS 962.96) TaxID=1314807 RepID=A0A4S8MIC0_DENBC|nr:hypothetical protein K435DRAFT_836336 [Dendrothele bispora CBS 962.96]
MFSSSSTSKEVPEKQEQDSDELSRFREEWKREVQQRREAGHKPQREAAPSTSSSYAPIIAPNLVPLITPIPQVHVASPSSPQTQKRPVISSASLNLNFTASSGPGSALAIYKQAVLHEENGELDEALQLYRQAFRKDPNVDKIYHREELLAAALTAGSSSLSSKTHVAKAHVIGTDAISGTNDDEDLSKTLQNLSLSRSSEHASKNLLASVLASFPQQLEFQPEEENTPVSINKLPDELLVDILKSLDTSAIERFASVSRKARVVSLESSIWRELVDATYKTPQVPDEDTVKVLLDQYLYDYRRLYIEHPRVRMDGVYIAVCHYVRAGQSENSWVNINHLITYHRYLRFFPNGQVISLLTNEGEHAPAQIIPLLKPTLKNMKGLFLGTWSLTGTTIIISNLIEAGLRSGLCLEDLSPSSPLPVHLLQGHAEHGSGSHGHGHYGHGHGHNQQPPQPIRYIFTMNLTLRSRPLGRWNKLDIVSYDSIHVETGDTQPVRLKHERPFWFSKVKSYAT